MPRLTEKKRALIAGRTKSALPAAKAKGVKQGNPNIKAAQEPAVAAVKAEADRAEQRHADHRRNPEVRRNDPPRNRPKP
jgi:hypothetical protein